MPEPERIARLRDLEAHLSARIMGQEHVLPRVASVFTRGECGLADPARPKGSLLFAGPTGTGKSETFKTAATYALGPGQVIPFDMSEYQDSSAVNRLLGSDRDDPGLLGRALLARRSGALFFDEVDKAHAPLMDVFLQILWDGRVTVATGQTFPLGEYYIGFATNIGGAEAMRMEHSSPARVEQAVLRRLRERLRPEFFGRVDEVLIFGRLTPEVQREICALEVERETRRLRALGYVLEVSDEVIEFLVREGFHPQLGARPLRRTIECQLQDAVVRELFASGSAGGRVTLGPEGNRLSIWNDSGSERLGSGRESSFCPL